MYSLFGSLCISYQFNEQEICLQLKRWHCSNFLLGYLPSNTLVFKDKDFSYLSIGVAFLIHQNCNGYLFRRKRRTRYSTNSEKSKKAR